MKIGKNRPNFGALKMNSPENSQYIWCEEIGHIWVRKIKIGQKLGKNWAKIGQIWVRENKFVLKFLLIRYYSYIKIV